MDISRKLGIMIFTGVPAIMGAGCVWAAFHSWIAIGIFEVLLYAGALYLTNKD